MLCLGGRVVAPEQAMDLVKEFLNARFEGDDPGGERNLRRIDKVKGSCAILEYANSL